DNNQVYIPTTVYNFNAWVTRNRKHCQLTSTSRLLILSVFGHQDNVYVSIVYIIDNYNHHHGEVDIVHQY
ncbi:hypothetical protein C7212DRAFT_41142, partial [Tuber magnatum]